MRDQVIATQLIATATRVAYARTSLGALVSTLASLDNNAVLSNTAGSDSVDCNRDIITRVIASATK
jgi:hypothetical protein